MRITTLKHLLAMSAFVIPLSSQAVTVDLMVVYDTYSKQVFSNQPDTAIRSWVDQINSAMQNSQVDVQVRLVGTVEHDVGGADMGAVLGNLRVDGFVAQKRAELGADYVTMIDNTGNCGVGYVAVDKNYAFNVVGPKCGALAMAHELGHTMGLTHSRKQGDTSGARYAYGMGHGVDNSFATIMTYEYLFNAPKVAKYSNPNIQCNGIPCGVPEGYSNSADAARAINNVRSEMASFYPTKVYNDGLSAGQSINAGQSLVSRNGRYRLSMQTDGNLVIYNPNGPIWSSGTWRSDANRLVMQNDGNLVLYGQGGARWASNTWKSSANRVVMQDDGNLVMYGPYGAVWASGTMGR